MAKEERIHLLVLIIIVGFSIAVVYHYVMGYYFGKPWPGNTFLYAPWDRFLDFTLVVRQSAALDPFGQDIKGFAGAPFAQLIGYLFSVIHPASLQLPLFFGSFLVVFVAMVKHFLYGLKARLASHQLLAVFVIAFLTYPVLFALDRANFDLLVCALLFLFALSYQRQKYTASTVFLALAVALKPYAVILAMVYVFDRRYRDVVLVLFGTLILSVLSLSLFKDGLFVETQKYFAALSQMNADLSGVSQHHYTSDLYGLLTVGIEFVGDRFGKIVYLPAHPAAVTAYTIVAAIVLIYFMIYLWKKRVPLWKAMAVLTMLLILLPYMSGDYRLIYLFVPMLMYMSLNEETRNDLLIVVLWGLLLVPKNYYTISGEQNIGMVINPLLLIGLLICIIPGAFSRKGAASTFRFFYKGLRSMVPTSRLANPRSS